MIHSFLGTGLRCPRCDCELVSDIEAADGGILRETLSCRCGYEEPVVQAPQWTREDIQRRLAIVKGRVA
jgi:hypothetical protein